MTIKDKLQLILKISGMTQQELAGRLGVTFAALNRWINAGVVPREGTQEKIDELYREYSGEKHISATALDAKKNLVARKQAEHPRVLKEILDNPDIRDQFYLSLTFHSNRIEGSTLSENETAAVLFENMALPNKSLVEQLEAKNHQAALEYLFNYLLKGEPVNEALVLKLHSILLNAIQADAGNYRQHGVRILGANVPTANYLKMPEIIKELMIDVSGETTDNIRHIADIHSKFEQIHPFADGNGRIGRMLMHAMALKVNLSPVVILQEKRQFYMAYLNKAQTGNDLSMLEDFICDAILRGYEIIETE